MPEAQMEKTTARQELIARFSQDAIAATKVLVVGAGATGNEVVKNLALTGFGYVFIADLDTISTSNLSRTVLFSKHDVGKPKAPLAAERFQAMSINGGVADSFQGDICHGLGEGVFRHVDLIVGCVDNDQSRLYVSNICQLLKKPMIDLGIEGFNWTLFAQSGQDGCGCYACSMGSENEETALDRVRNSCDVTRRRAAEEGHVPTIAVSAASVGALAAQPAIRIAHQLITPDSMPLPPMYGMSFYTARDNRQINVKIGVRRDCAHHDNYKNHGDVHESPISAHWKLRDALEYVRDQYGKPYAIATYKDNACADRSFITHAMCVSCGKHIRVFRPQPLYDEDLLCEACRAEGAPPRLPSNGIQKNWFSLSDEEELLDMTLLDLGIPLLHIVEFAPVDGDSESLYLELTGDIDEVMPNLPKKK